MFPRARYEEAMAENQGCCFHPPLLLLSHSHSLHTLHPLQRQILPSLLCCGPSKIPIHRPTKLLELNFLRWTQNMHRESQKAHWEVTKQERTSWFTIEFSNYQSIYTLSWCFNFSILNTKPSNRDRHTSHHSPREHWGKPTFWSSYSKYGSLYIYLKQVLCRCLFVYLFVY